ncbi:hypothetical protein [Oryzobacter terrae]|uniref:hypothetical protein n=1 Tax=Oryzobacter terrae TaxID=1620385 RepID=UPI00367160FF
MTEVTPGGPAPQGPRPQGTIRLTLQGNALTAGLTPVVHVGGHRLNSRYGTMDVPVWAGPNRVDVHAQWTRRYGEASLEVDVPPGGVVPVFYAAPHHVFSRGDIGLEPQRRRGLAASIAIILGSIGLVVAALVGVFALAIALV